MSTKRPIAPVDLPNAVPGIVPTARPELTWIDPRELLVDDAYQRGIGEKGTKLIRRIVETFDWRKFKPPTAVWTDDGLEVLDGQHSAIAAATHPDIDVIPVVVVEAEEVAQRAEAFLGLNRDRLAVSAMEMHAAAVVAGEPAAAAIERVCQACGVTVLRMPRAGGACRPRDTVAVRAIGDLIRRVGEDLATRVVHVLAEAEVAGISAAALRAVEVLLVNPEFADQVDGEKITRAIVALGAEAEREAGVFAATHCVPRWRGLVAVWFQEAKKRKPTAHVAVTEAPPAAIAPAASSTTPKPAAGGRVILRPVKTGAVAMGEPAPGRSALDQRRAAQ